MAQRPLDLPDFESPPVSEVALAIRYSPLPRLQSVDMRLVWELFAAEYPKVQERPPFEMPIEVIGVRGGGQQSVRFEMVGTPPQPRLWFLTDDETSLLQFQNNFFAANWRKQASVEPYPRYEQIREVFASKLALLSAFAADREFGSIVPVQCEVTYINQIELPKEQPYGRAADTIFSHWGGWPPDAALPQLEDCGFVARFVLTAPDGGPAGRLIANAEPRFSGDGPMTTQFTLTARGTPSQPTIEAALQFIDHGRLAIVRAFAAMTTPEMHQRWKRRQ